MFQFRLESRGRPVRSESCGPADDSVLELLGLEIIKEVGDRFVAVTEVANRQGLVEAERLPWH